MQTFGLGSDGVFGGCQAEERGADGSGMGKGDRVSSCGQFIIDEVMSQRRYTEP